MNNHPLFKIAPSRKDKDAPTRIKTYLKWLEANSSDWREPDLVAYSNFLLHVKKLTPQTVASYVSAVKRQYRRVLSEYPLDQFSSDELTAMRVATELHTGQPEYNRDVHVVHLTQAQIERLLTLPDTKTKMGLRDTIVMALILFTGISESELCELQVKDLVGEGDGLSIKLAERTVRVSDTMFYNTAWLEAYIQHWLQITDIKAGYIFRGFYRGGNVIRKHKLNPNAVYEIVRRYTEYDPDMPKFTVLDLRRTYARRLFDNGVPIDDIRYNLGFASKQTVIGYVGLPDIAGELGSDQRGSSEKLHAQSPFRHCY